MLPVFFVRSRGLSKLYNRLFTPLLAKYGLTQTEADILMFLANNPGYDTAHDIVEQRHLAKSHISSGVEALAGRGLLERYQHEGNRKTIHLRLTEAASPIIKEGRCLQKRYGRLLFAGLSKSEIHQLMRLLDHVAQNVDAALEQDGSLLPPASKQGSACTNLRPI